MATGSPTSSVGLDAELRSLVSVGEAVQRRLGRDLDDAARERAIRLAGEVADRIRVVLRRHRIRERIKCTRTMTPRQRHTAMRDRYYRIARERGVPEHHARRIAIDATRPRGSAVQLTRERRPGSAHTRRSRRGSSSRSSGSRGDPDPGDPDPPAKKRRPCVNCAAYTESTVDYRGHRADLCAICMDRLAEGQRPVLAALERAYEGETA